MRLVTLWCLSLGLVAASSQGQSITSFEPDTASRSTRERTPPDMVDIPVWFGWQISPVALAASTLERSKLALGAAGAIAFESSRRLLRFSPWSHVELSLRVERALRVPKRIVPGL